MRLFYRVGGRITLLCISGKKFHDPLEIFHDQSENFLFSVYLIGGLKHLSKLTIHGFSLAIFNFLIKYGIKRWYSDKQCFPNIRHNLTEDFKRE